MKIILLKNVPNVGKANQIVEISDGYAKNFIIPKKLGIIATTGAIKQLETSKEKVVDELKVKIEALAAIKAKIDNCETLFIDATADAKGNINGNISPKQIADCIQGVLEIKLDKKAIEKKSISSFGTSSVKIELYKGIVAIAKINVRRK